MEKITIIIPVLNEEGNLELLFQELNNIKNKLQKEVFIDFIFVNDGSTDRTSSILSDMAEKFNYVKIISFTRNFGHQQSLCAGINFSDSDYVVTIDSDLQDPPELIEDMYRLSKNGYDVVYAQRESRDGESFFKILTAKIFYRFINLICDLNIPKDTGDYRLITKKVVVEFKKFKEKHKFIRGLIPWLGFKSTSVLFKRKKRHTGETNYNLIKMISFAIDAALSFSTRSLIYLSNLGIIFIIISIIYAFFILYKKLFLDQIIPGFTTILLFIIFFGGLNLFFLGILGQYISKIFEQSKNRPEYVIKELKNF